MNGDIKKKMLVLRFSNYKKYDFLQEHKNVINRDGATWFLKLGKPVPQKSLEEILAGSKSLILKSPKVQGDKYYYCKMLDARNTKPDSTMAYPDYYHELMDDMFWFSFEGTWIKVNGFQELKDDEISKLRLVSNNRLLSEVLQQTRTTMLYAYSIERRHSDENTI